ncbi:glycosyltransferase family 2 protein [Autumnicola musiva]|uniref:Glycosyltransferase n=1 Tax=Autumnicola musiva TaxID=3075589 RepID=A0ABU3D5J1_9FLAO|nr:glycosyltransferase [Zunongwangia sp. F117]MDT0676802.1 glycosyltransferase [Zunongwangia sp. F117]
MTEVLVSIIIPCYNDGKYIEQALQSALDQKYPYKEIIVVDDGSDQKTKQVLEKLKPKMDIFLSQENRGVVAARNRAIDIAKGTYIMTLDADDYFDSSFLGKAVSVLDSNTEVGMVSCHANIIDQNKNKHIQIPNGEDFNKAIFRNNVYASLLFRKQCWKDVNGYDPNMAMGFEDWEFNISVSKAGWNIMVIPEALFYYRVKKKSRNYNAKKHQKELRSYVFYKHKDIGVQNYQETIAFFLNEIEDLRSIIKEYQHSRSYKLGFILLKPMRVIRKIFRI